MEFLPQLLKVFDMILQAHQKNFISFGFVLMMCIIV
jgi:hypothetical protein